MKKKIYYINLLNIESRVLRRSVLHSLSRTIKYISFFLGVKKFKKKKVEISNYSERSKILQWKYIGEIKKNKPHGKGKVLFTNSYNFKGTFKDGMATGIGEENNKGIFGLGKYIGEYFNNSRHGDGTFLFYDGSKYIGKWKNNYRHGIGKYIFKDGFKLEGKWHNDFFVGFKWKNISATKNNYLKLIENFYLVSKIPKNKKFKNQKNPEMLYEGNIFKYIDHNEKNNL